MSAQARESEIQREMDRLRCLVAERGGNVAELAVRENVEMAVRLRLACEVAGVNEPWGRLLRDILDQAADAGMCDIDAWTTWRMGVAVWIEARKLGMRAIHHSDGEGSYR